MVRSEVSVHDLVAGHQWEELRNRVQRLHPSDVADILVARPEEEEGVIFRLLPKAKAAAAFSYLPPERQEELLHSLSKDEVHALVDDMTPDDRTRLLEEMPAAVSRELLLRLEPQEVAAARELLGYPENTAGRYMTPEYAWIYPDMTAGRALEKIRQTGRGKETLNWVYVIDNDGKLVED